MPYETFWHLTPKKLDAFYEAYRIKKDADDEKMWLMGLYIQSAVGTAVEHCLAGRKAKSKYVDKPLLKDIAEKNRVLSEEELQLQRELFVAKLEVMKTNFELNHKIDKK